ncbi:GlxA family transcriptional regulator [Actinoallomurus iriomotensis]|uniref:AraC family transcriptional regulator n=1 Tax=Actinoallomurus iriomotensis TaxID=478107 RepID=A0A9W6S3Q2_9ACTN|nr:helix-turn-helix domain-containing protein [Actinoallomurus iriomotensis]GLY85197.1 AraC family transcriptional regulator [Actinoallomurus iriomotensis]
MRKRTDAHRVAVAVMPGAPIFELAVPCEVFGISRPELADPWYEFRLCATEPGATIAGGFTSTSPCGLDDLAAADTVIVPACANVHSRQPDGLVAAVAQAYERGARIAAICSGAFVLAQAGLLDGRRATTHWMHADELRRRFPRVDVDETVIFAQDGRIHTSAGTAAGIDLCIELVRHDHGTTVANALARRMVTPPHRGADQAQYILAPLPTTKTSSLAGVMAWAIDHLDQPIRLRDLAARANLSERQLTRRFLETHGRTPGGWLTRERLRRAQELLEQTDLTVDAVASRSGFATAAGLRAAFTKHLHTAPSDYRNTWRAV